MLTYNTHEKDLILPEYGRNIQRMVDHCLTLTDREERTRCASSIVKTMSILFPQTKNDEETNRKFWDHLAIMSHFALDIDWPYEVIRPDEIQGTPERVPYDISDISRRQYGRNIITMVKVAADMEPGEERDAFVTLIANQMKKVLLSTSDDAPEERILRDLYELSEGRVNYAPGEILLQEYNIIVPSGKKKKKK